MTRRHLAVALLSSGVALAGQARADSLTPATFSANIAVGGSVSIDKVGSITAGMPTSAKADVLFLTDTTGSMGPAISEIQSAFSSTVASLNSMGNFATGAAEYKDATSAGDPFNYQLDQAITTNSSLTQTAINNYSAGGGGDDPEQGLYALTQATGAATGFRSGAKEIVVLVGDAPSHDNAHPPVPTSITTTSVAASLVAAGATVEALNASNITGDTGLNTFGQFSGADSIFAHGAAGSYTSAFPSASNLTALLTSLIGSAFATYSDVSLDLIGPAPSHCSVSLPSDITGSFDRSTTRNFDFAPVSITGTSAGTCSFSIALEADGAILATESDSIMVGGVAVPEPASIALMGMGLLGLVGVRRRFRL